MARRNLVAVCVLGLIVVRSTKTDPAAAVAVSNAAPEASEIDITVRVFPADARVLIDGQVESRSPVVVKRKRDGAMHSIRAESPGFLPREEKFAFDRNIVLMLDLQPLVSGNGGTAPPPSTLSADPNKKKPATAGKPKGKKPFGLDTENPY